MKRFFINLVSLSVIVANILPINLAMAQARPFLEQDVAEPIHQPTVLAVDLAEAGPMMSFGSEALLFNRQLPAGNTSTAGVINVPDTSDSTRQNSATNVLSEWFTASSEPAPVSRQVPLPLLSLPKYGASVGPKLPGAAQGQIDEPETVTDADGLYNFSGLSKGTHKITLDPATLPLRFQPAVEESSPVIWVNPGQEIVSDPLSTGVRFTAKYDGSNGNIEGVVFWDENGNGIQDVAEPGLADVRVIDPTIHQYFVPFNDRDLWNLFDDKDTGLPGTQQCYASATAVSGLLRSFIFVTSGSDGSVVYYDHWEDGYDTDPFVPAASTEVLILDAGTTQLFQTDIDESLVGPTPNPSYYDGRDRITVFGEAASVVRMAYPQNPGTVLAAAWEVSEVADLGRTYNTTVGEDLDFNGPATADDHDFAGASIMAVLPNTTVTYTDSNGVVTSIDLPNAGDTYFINGQNNGLGNGGVDSGDVISSNNPIQVQLLTGACGEIYSARGYTLQPVDTWTNEYWAPVPGFTECLAINPASNRLGAETDVQIHNPHNFSINVTVSNNVDTVTISVPALTTVSVLEQSAWADISSLTQSVHLVSTDNFWGLSAIDTSSIDGSSQEHDWGYSLIPVSQLTSQVVVGYAPGNGDANPTDSGNLAFVTAVTDTVVYVDLDQDGLPDPIDMNGDGDANDTTSPVFASASWSEPLSMLGVPLRAGEVLRVADPNDQNLQGALIYSRDLSEKIAVAWGQDPCRATVNRPYLDLGYTTLPFPIPSFSKFDELAVDADGTNDISPGDTLSYTMVVFNNGQGAMVNPVLTDSLPYTYSDFVVGSLSSTLTPSAIEYSNDGVDFTASENPDIQALRIRWPLISAMQRVTVTFRLQIHPDVPPTVTQITNQAVIDSDNTNPTSSEDPEDPTDPDTDTPIGRPQLGMVKLVEPDTVRPGQPFTYTIVTSNTGTGVALDFSLTDDLPDYIQYVPDSMSLSWPETQIITTSQVVTRHYRFSETYADDFDQGAASSGYAGSDGSLTWVNDWAEVADDGNVATGEVTVQTDAANAPSDPGFLLLSDTDGDNAGVIRTVNLTGFVAPTLRFVVFGSGTGGTDDDLRVQLNGVSVSDFNSIGYGLREVNLSAQAGNAAATIAILAEGGLDAGDFYRVDNISIYEAGPNRTGTDTITQQRGELFYTTLNGINPLSYTLATGQMVITNGVRLPSNGIITATFQVTPVIPLTDGLVLNNIATADASNWLTPLQATVPVTIVSSHVLTITKTDDPDPVTPGNLLTYTMVYSAHGDSPAPNTIITDTTPPGTTFVSAEGGLSITDPGAGNTGTVTWSLGNLLPVASGITFQTGVVTLVVRVDPDIPLSAIPILNHVRISDDDGVTDDDIELTDVLLADVAIVKDVQPAGAVSVGDTITWTLTYSNEGPIPAMDVTIVDTLPPGVTFGGVVSEAPPLSGPVVSPPTLAWDMPSLAVGASGSIVITGSVDMTTYPNPILTNTVRITTTTPETNTTNNFDQTATPVIGLGINKRVWVGNVQVGDVVNYTIDVTNIGYVELITVPLTDVYEPAYLDFISASPPHDSLPALGTITWNNVGPLLPGQSAGVVLTFTAVTSTPVGIGSPDQATATGTTPGGETTGPVTDDAVVYIGNPATPQLEMSKDVSVSLAVYSSTVRYTVAITNTGDVAFTTLRVTDTLPSGLTFENGYAFPAQPSQVNGQQLVWNNVLALSPYSSPFMPNQVITVSYDVRVTTPITGEYRNLAQSTGTWPGGSITTNDDVPVFVTDPKIDLDKALIAPGAVDGIVTYTIRLTNTGPSTLDIIPLFDNFDSTYLKFLRAEPTQSLTSTGFIRWNDLTVPAPNGFGINLVPADSFLITTVFEVIEPFAEPITNTAVTSDVVDIFGNVPPRVDDSVPITDGAPPGAPTAIFLKSFDGIPLADSIKLFWETTREENNRGFHIWRSETGDLADAVRITEDLIPGQGYGTGGGATYEYIDRRVTEGAVYTYWLVDIEFDDVSVDDKTPEPNDYNTTEVRFDLLYKLYLPVVIKD